MADGMEPAEQLTPAQIRAARSAHAVSGRPIVEELANAVRLDPAALVRQLADSLGLRYVTLAEIGTWQADFSELSYADAVRRKAAVIRDEAGRRHILICDPFDYDLARWTRSHFPRLMPVLLHFEEMAAWLQRQEESLTATTEATFADAQDHPFPGSVERLDLAEISTHPSPIVQFVNSTLYDALKSGASDLHFESGAAGLLVRFRLDGVLSVVARRDGISVAEQILSRIKVMAELDISERRVPQDGRLQLSRNGRLIDVRVSIMPSIYGEDAVLRVLDRKSLESASASLSLATLGFPAETAKIVRSLARAPYGMLLVTGPTGSGKTTTLYAALSDTHSAEDKTITIEDPVEYQLAGILQIPVNEKKGLTFARGLRSILRHDPDRILVGEIRDAETAQIAVQSALTGHIVFSTVHANGVLDVFGRFLQFGIDPYSFVSAVNGILAQRLLRKLCDQCAIGSPPSSEVLKESAVPESLWGGAWRAAVGCANCRGTGYRGRFPIGELLRLNSSLKSMVADRASLAMIEDAARSAGLVPLRRLALDAASAGITSLQEADRVTAA